RADSWGAGAEAHRDGESASGHDDITGSGERTNRAEHAHRPARERGQRRRFTPPASTHPLLPVQAIFGPHFRPERRRWRATSYRRQRTRRVAPWHTARGLAAETLSAASLPHAQLAMECLTSS